MALEDKNKKRDIEKLTFKDSVPSETYHYFSKREVDYFNDGEIDTSWIGEWNRPFVQEDDYLDGIIKDNDFIGYANPVGGSRDIYANPQSGVECLFRVSFIRKVDYLYFQKWHKDLGSNFTLSQLMEDGKDGKTHVGKVGAKLTVKLSDTEEPIELFMLGFKALKLDGNQISECPLSEADIKATHGC